MDINELKDSIRCYLATLDNTIKEEMYATSLNLAGHGLQRGKQAGRGS